MILELWREREKIWPPADETFRAFIRTHGSSAGRTALRVSGVLLEEHTHACKTHHKHHKSENQTKIKPGNLNLKQTNRHGKNAPNETKLEGHVGINIQNMPVRSKSTLMKKDKDSRILIIIHDGMF